MLENHVAEIKTEWVVCPECQGQGEIYFKNAKKMLGYLRSHVTGFSEAMYLARQYVKTNYVQCQRCGGDKGWEDMS